MVHTCCSASKRLRDEVGWDATAFMSHLLSIHHLKSNLVLVAAFTQSIAHISLPHSSELQQNCHQFSIARN